MEKGFDDQRVPTYLFWIEGLNFTGTPLCVMQPNGEPLEIGYVGSIENNKKPVWIRHQRRFQIRAREP